MAELTVQEALVTGLAPVLVAAQVGGDTFQNNGHVLLEVVNGGGAPINVTINDENSPTPPGATAFNGDVVVAVPAGATRLIGPFPPWRFNQPSGLVGVAYSAVTSVTVRAILTSR